MDVDPEQTRYEPLPRWGHVSVVIDNKLYLWGGRIEDFSEESKKEVSPSILLLYVLSLAGQPLHKRGRKGLVSCLHTNCSST